MTKRWRRKAVELEAVRQNATDPNGNQVQGWRVWHPELFWSVWVTLHEFERDYEPVPPSGDGHMIDFGAKKIDCPHEAPLKLADELAEAVSLLLSRYFNLPTQAALSKYLESRKPR